MAFVAGTMSATAAAASGGGVSGGVNASAGGSGSASASRKQRILALHGFRQDGEVFRAKTGALRKALRGVADVHVMEAPHAGPSRRAWWSATSDGRSYRGFDASMDAIKAEYEREGPFDGVLGFSQGGLLASILSAHPDAPNFRYAIIFSAFPARCDEFRHAEWYKDIPTPSFHVWGAEDDLVPPFASKLLMERYENPKSYVHNAGHVLPPASNKQCTSQLCAFIISNAAAPTDTATADADVASVNGTPEAGAGSDAAAPPAPHA